MSMPVIILKSSPPIWDALPVPPDAMLILPGLALAQAMNSGTVFAGFDRFTSMTSGRLLIIAIGTMSRMKLKLRCWYSVALVVTDCGIRSSV